MKPAIAIVLMAVTAAGCASRPDRVQASLVPDERYMASDCTELAASMAEARGQLERFWSMQDTKADLDKASVLIAFVPASLFTGDHAADVARYKGEVMAIGTALARKGCMGRNAA